MVKIKIINTQRVLSPTQITLGDYVINPYRGCEFNCCYCYSQENKNIKRDGFGQTLGIKSNAPDILEKELKYKKPKRVLLGSTTECFQHQELKYKLSEKILQILNKHQIPYTILTKSHFIGNYLPLIAENKENKIYFTFNFHSDDIIKLFEKNSSSVGKRLATIKKIIKSQIALRIHIGPFIPYISDLDKIFELIPENIKELDIELYHHKQGNFKALMLAIKQNFDKILTEKIRKIYKSKQNYDQYVKSLRYKISQLNKKHPYAFYYIVPDFDEFYNPRIDYEKPLRNAG